jgi:hypothetical protein
MNEEGPGTPPRPHPFLPLSFFLLLLQCLYLSSHSYTACSFCSGVSSAMLQKAKSRNFFGCCFLLLLPSKEKKRAMIIFLIYEPIVN